MSVDTWEDGGLLAFVRRPARATGCSMHGKAAELSTAAATVVCLTNPSHFPDPDPPSLGVPCMQGILPPESQI